MSNILIIKHGSLGDIAQASGAIQDIFENHKNSQIYLLTTKPYFDLFKKNPFINEVILDKRLSRFNLLYLFPLMKKLKKLNFFKVYDLQNSSRTKFYKTILFPKSNLDTWSSSLTTLPQGIDKEQFDKKPVLERFEHQLKTSGLETKNTLKPDFNWSCSEIEHINPKAPQFEQLETISSSTFVTAGLSGRPSVFFISLNRFPIPISFQPSPIPIVMEVFLKI